MSQKSMFACALTIMALVFPLTSTTKGRWAPDVLRIGAFQNVGSDIYISTPSNEHSLPYLLQKGDLIELDIIMPIVSPVDYQYTIGDRHVVKKANPYRQLVKSVMYNGNTQVAHYFRGISAGSTTIEIKINDQLYFYKITVFPQ